MIGALLKRWRERRLPPPGTLTSDGWYDWDSYDGIFDTWIEGFSAGEIEALGGYHVVRVYLRIAADNSISYNFDVYDDRPEDDVLEPVMVKKGPSWCDWPIPEWLEARIIAACPEWQGEESLVG